MKPSALPAHAPSRRQFLASAALAPLAFAALGGASARGQAAAPERSSAGTASPRSVLGLELYSVRGALSRDLPGTLQALGRMGYGAVEFYAPYMEWTAPYAKDVRARLDDCGLKCFSTHNHIESFTPGAAMDKAIELNQILGTRILVMAMAPKGVSGEDGWTALAGQLTSAVDRLRPHGLTAGYHNHEAEWSRLENGSRVIEIIAAHTPSDFVLQLDVGTCVAAGADPVAWIKGNPGRIRSIHLKDWAPGEASAEKGFRVLFGEGVTPWKELIAAAESVGGVEHYLMEQEGSRYSELETARRCLEAWKTLIA